MIDAASSPVDTAVVFYLGNQDMIKFYARECLLEFLYGGLNIGRKLLYLLAVKAQRRSFRTFFRVRSGPAHYRFTKMPSPRRISSRKAGSKEAANRLLAMLNFAGCACKSDSVKRRSSARFSAALRLLTRL